MLNAIVSQASVADFVTRTLTTVNRPAVLTAAHASTKSTVSFACVKIRILELIATQTIQSVGKIRRSALVTARAFRMPKILRSSRAGVRNRGAETAPAVRQATVDRIARRANIRGPGKTVSWIGGTVNPTPVFKGGRAIP